MKQYRVQKKLHDVAAKMEILVGVCILIVIAASTLGLLATIHFPTIISSPETVQVYLTTAMTIIIGIEFVKMIFSYTIDTVIEVMMLAVARQMVVSHTSPAENLLTVAAVALLFVVRKYLFVHQLDHAERKEFSESKHERKEEAHTYDAQ